MRSGDVVNSEVGSPKASPQRVERFRHELLMRLDHIQYRMAWISAWSGDIGTVRNVSDEEGGESACGHCSGSLAFGRLSTNSGKPRTPDKLCFEVGNSQCWLHQGAIFAALLFGGTASHAPAEVKRNL